MKELELSEKIIFVCTIIFCIFLHTYNLNQISGWTDEFATMYFAEYLSEVYATETHPPLFYAIMKPFLWIFGKDLAVLRLCVGIMSTALIVWAVAVTKRMFGWRGAVLIAVLLVFNPVEIIHARMVRQYSIFLELTVLLILYALDNRYKTVAILGFILSWIHPIGFFPVLAIMGYQLYIDRKAIKPLAMYAFSIFPIFIYYFSKLFVLEGRKYLTGYNPSTRIDGLIISTLKNMAGEFFPKVNFHPPSLEFQLFLAALMIGLFLYSLKKPISKSLWMLISFLLITVISTEIVSRAMVDIKYGRYFLYLFAPFIILAVDKFRHTKFSVPIAFAIGLISLSAVNPFLYYPGEREALVNINEESQGVFCANEFQYYYYFNSIELSCVDQFNAAMEKKKDIYFVDFNAYGLPLLKEINANYHIYEYKKFGIVTMAKATYKKKKK
jgi:hypothetical protein